MRTIFIAFIFLLAGINSHAQVTSHSVKTIPFATYSIIPQASIEKEVRYENSVPILQMKIEGTEVGKVGITAQVDQVDPVKLTKFVKNIRDTLCASIGDANVKVWVSFDAQAKMLVVSANGRTGIEIVFHCK